MKKIQVSHQFENTSFSKDVFRTLEQPVRYFNRNIENGTWYSTLPYCFENDTPIRDGIAFEILSDGKVCALDGNGDFEGKKPFVPFSHFIKALTIFVQNEHPRLRDYYAMKEKLLSLPGGEVYAKPGGRWENWAFALDFGNETEQVVESAKWMMREYHILTVRYTHKPTSFVFTNYRLRSSTMAPKSASHDLLLYDWETNQ